MLLGSHDVGRAAPQVPALPRLAPSWPAATPPAPHNRQQICNNHVATTSAVPQLSSPPARRSSGHSTRQAHHAWPAASAQAVPHGWPSQPAPAGPCSRCCRQSQRCCRCCCAVPRWWCTHPLGHLAQTAWARGAAGAEAGIGAGHQEPKAHVACASGEGHRRRAVQGLNMTHAAAQNCGVQSELATKPLITLSPTAPGSCPNPSIRTNASPSLSASRPLQSSCRFASRRQAFGT